MGKAKDETKKFLVGLMSRSKRFILDIHPDLSYKTILKATWNDNLLPKNKHFFKIKEQIIHHYRPVFNSMNPYSNTLFTSTNEGDLKPENIIRNLEVRLMHYKWKVVLKTLLLMNKLSNPIYCGELAFLFYNKRPNIFLKTFPVARNIPAYQDRAHSINSLLNYLHIKLQNFNIIGRKFIYFNDLEDLETFLEGRFIERTFRMGLNRMIVQLKYISEVKFPEQTFSNQMSIYFNQEIYEEGCLLFKNIIFSFFYYFDSNKNNVDYLRKEVEQILKVFKKFKINYRNFIETENNFKDKTDNFGIEFLNGQVKMLEVKMNNTWNIENKEMFHDVFNL
eukprot:GAHX01002420.1.p1 GENE.GAHX01002420.1~~GAHX01002420.1.p1  ORF type:complete len:335 (-),score=63.31 GAHX01002420.1:49-1053(-)